MTKVQPATSAGRRSPTEPPWEVRWFENQVRQQMDAQAEGVLLHDNGEIVQLNQRVSALLGRQPGEVLGRHLKDLVTPSGSAKLEQWLALDHRVPLFIFALRKGGSPIPVELRQSARLLYQGRRVRWTWLVEG